MKALLEFVAPLADGEQVELVAQCYESDAERGVDPQDGIQERERPEPEELREDETRGLVVGGDGDEVVAAAAPGAMAEERGAERSRIAVNERFLLAGERVVGSDPMEHGSDRGH